MADIKGNITGTADADVAKADAKQAAIDKAKQEAADRNKAKAEATNTKEKVAENTAKTDAGINRAALNETEPDKVTGKRTPGEGIVPESVAAKTNAEQAADWEMQGRAQANEMALQQQRTTDTVVNTGSDVSPEQQAHLDKMFQDEDDAEPTYSPSFGASPEDNDLGKEAMVIIAKIVRSSSAASDDHVIFGHVDNQLKMKHLRVLAKHVPPEELDA